MCEKLSSTAFSTIELKPGVSFSEHRIEGISTSLTTYIRNMRAPKFKRYRLHAAKFNDARETKAAGVAPPRTKHGALLSDI